MTHLRASLLLLVPLVPPAAARAGDEGRDLTEGFELPAGLKVELWAESPQLHNPTAIDVDAAGRVWVAEAVNYRKWEGRNPGREHPAGDRIVVLADEDKDGACDRARTFVQDEELVAPLGICVLGGDVYVSCSPSLFVYRDTDGDGAADERETLLTGFGGHDHDHGLHSVVPGPDGRLYAAVGNAGPHLVTDRDGWTLRSGSLYSGGGAAEADNKPGLASDDGRVWVGGLVLRLDPDGGGLAVLAHNFRNEYEVALDAFGNLFTSDNDDDGNQSCRTLWCLPGGDHGYVSADGARTWQADRRPGQDTQSAHWHQEDPGVVPAGTINGAGGPTGVCVYEGELLAAELSGAVLNADAGARAVYAHRPRRAGAGIALDPAVLIRPRPEIVARDERGATWFRPSDVAVGPDGAVYVADWYDPGVGGHLAGDQAAYGRILRIAPEGARPSAPELETEGARPSAPELETEGARPSAPELETGGARPRVPELDLATIDGALAALASPAVSVRELGRRALCALAADERTRTATHAALQALAAGKAAVPLRGRALWALAAIGDRGSVLRYVAHEDTDLRIAAMRALALTAGGPLTREEILQRGLARDEDAAVRRELALELRGRPFEQAIRLWLELAAAWDGRDRWYLEALGLAAQGDDDRFFAELALELGQAPRDWDARFEGLAWRLHAPAAREAFTARALDSTLPQAARRRAIDALAFMPERAAAEAVLTIAGAGPADLREHARFWLRQRATNDWRAFGLAGRLGEPELGEAQLAWESGVVRAGLVDVNVDVGGAELLWLVVTDGGDGNSCDWADWIEPRFAGPDREWALAELPCLLAEAEWGEVHAGASCAGGELAVGGEVFGTGIGTHAASQIAYAVPEGATRFLARAGPDRGGTSQNEGRTTSLAFQVRLARPDARPPIAAWESRLLDRAAAREERAEAAAQLARDPQGALRLIELARAGKIDAELARAIADALPENSDLGVRALASQRFPKDAPRTARANVLALDGDPARGRRVFQDAARAQCITCHAYTLGETTLGGDIGPDLTRIGEKYGDEALLDAILAPSAGIAVGYETWLIETEDGLLHSGFVLADGPTLVLKDTQGKRVVLDAANVAARTKQTISTMPEGVALGLAPQELRDLVAFLREDPARHGELGDEIALFDGTSLDGWTFHLDDPDARMEDVWSVEDGVLVCKGSPAGYLRTEAAYESFLLTLEWRFDPERGAGNSGVLLRRNGQDQVWPRSLEAQLHSRNAGDIWNIGEMRLCTDPARLSGRRTLRMQPSSEKPLGEWNRYEILLDGPRLELRVNGVLQNTADWCEEIPGEICLQSEGAEIHFRDVRLRPIRR